MSKVGMHAKVPGWRMYVPVVVGVSGYPLDVVADFVETRMPRRLLRICVLYTISSRLGGMVDLVRLGDREGS